MKQYLAIDIGGTAVKLGIVDETGAVGPKAEESVNFDGYQTPVLTTVLKAAKAFVETQNIDVKALEGVGVSATGQIDSRKGIVAGTCGNFPNYINSPIQAELERLFGLPVTVANDANCMTLGEVWVGGAKGYTDVIGVTLGTGVGGGILTGGRLLRVPADWAVSWATTAPMHWTVFPAPAVPPAAGSATPPPRLWYGPHRKRTPPGKTAAPFLLPQRLATRPFWPCWMPGRMRSHRALQAWCTSLTRSSFSSAAA